MHSICVTGASPEERRSLSANPSPARSDKKRWPATAGASLRACNVCGAPQTNRPLGSVKYRPRRGASDRRKNFQLADLLKGGLVCATCNASPSSRAPRYNHRSQAGHRRSSSSRKGERGRTKASLSDPCCGCLVLRTALLPDNLLCMCWAVAAPLLTRRGGAGDSSEPSCWVRHESAIDFMRCHVGGGCRRCYLSLIGGLRALSIDPSRAAISLSSVLH